MNLKKRFFALVSGVFLCISFNYAKDSQVDDLLHKLFTIMDTRHREILSIEDNITHNRSTLEKESLTRILEQKVRKFLHQESQVQSVLDELKNSKDADKIFLYKTSKERLDRLHGNIAQIQELYFRKPLEVSENAVVQTGSNFEEFLNTWEEKRSVGDPEKKTVKTIVSAGDKKYFDHLKKEYLQGPGEPEMNEFLGEMNKDAKEGELRQELVASADQSPLDKYHHSLKNEPGSRIDRIHRKDESFSEFYSNLETNLAQDSGMKDQIVSARKLPMDSTPQNTPKDYEEQILPLEQTPKSPLQQLVEDMKKYKAEQRQVQKMPTGSVKQGFEGFMDQLALSSERRANPATKSRIAAESDWDFERFASKAKNSASTNPDEDFAKFHASLNQGQEKNQNEFETLSKMTREPARIHKSSFHSVFDSIEQKPATSAPLSSQANQNHYQHYLEALKVDNRASLAATEWNLPQENILENEMNAVFQAPAKQAKEIKSVKSGIPDFNEFPSEIPHSPVLASVSDAAELKNLVPEKSEQIPEFRLRSEAEKKINTEETIYDKIASAVAKNPVNANSESKAEEPVSGRGLAGSVPLAEQRITQKAQARLLRKGASLIPVRIEARDTKDRLYADLPILFEVEMEPKNFISGHILDAYTDSPWKKTVETNADGVAQIHLFLDLNQQEVNISRTLLSTKEKTVCKIKITPKI